ncbi:uncharacterized protein ACO6RY_17756 [Pungitius sinensis]
MSSGSSDMVGVALGTAFSLLLLASITQGDRDVEIFHHERIKAVAGQNVTLPCTVKSSSAFIVVSMEWRKKQHEDTKLAVYTPGFGFHLFWLNITMQIENNSMGSHLQLYGVTKQDSGVYVCHIASFPHGSTWRETMVEITDEVNITCDVNGAVEVHAGDNVTINCIQFHDAKYKWTKNEALVSDNESLELWFVADAHTGNYTLSVDMGNQTVHKEFVITVLTATTSTRTDQTWTLPSRSNSTEEGWIQSADGGLTTHPTAALSTTDAAVTWTVNMTTDVKDDAASYRNVTGPEHVTSSTNPTRGGVTVTPAAHTDPYPLSNSTDQELHATHNVTTLALPDPQVARNLSTTMSYGHEVFGWTQGEKNESVGGDPGAASTPSTGRTTVVVQNEGPGEQRSHLMFLVILVPAVALMAAVGFLYLRRKQKERLGLPPPFKPPPPPVKYTAARPREGSAHPFATSRCHSVNQV